MLICAVMAQSQSTPSAADIFFLDLGIVIEPATGNETYSRLIKTPSEEVKIRIKKVKSGAVYMAASKEMMEALKRIRERMDELERSFQIELRALRQDNQELRSVLAEFAAPPLAKPERPAVGLAVSDEDLDISDASAITDLPVVSMLPKIKLPEHVNMSPPPEFNQSVYMSGVFAYEREDYPRALKNFSQLALDLTSSRTACNVLYWIADSYQQLGQYDQALETLDKLLGTKNAGRMDDALIQKGLVFRKTGREDLALAAFNEVVINHPESEYMKLAKMELKKAEVIQ